MRREEADGNTDFSQPRCEIDKTLLGRECQDPGEIRYRGALRLIRVQIRTVRKELE